MHHIGTTRASLVAPLTSMSSEGRWLLRGSIRRAAWMESDCMDGGMDGRVRHAYPVLYGVQYRYMRCTGSSGRGGARRFHLDRYSFCGALLNAGDSGVRTRNGIYNDVYDGGTHQIHGQTPQCGIRLWTPGIRASADALRGRDPRRLWLTVQRSGMVGIRGRGAAATGAQQESSRACCERGLFTA